jgi:hypothetical protein
MKFLKKTADQTASRIYRLRPKAMPQASGDERYHMRNGVGITKNGDRRMIVE